MVEAHHKNSAQYDELAILFRAGLKGDGLAYQRFLQAITPIFHRIVSRKLSASDVEDTVQEILISVHKARHTFDGERPLMPWLMAIVNFRITDSLRKSYTELSREHIDIDEYAEVLADVTNTHSTTESIKEMLKDVPVREREILTLMHGDGYTAKETGVRLGMKESAVKVAAFRAIKKLREKLVP